MYMADTMHVSTGFHKRALDGYVILVPRSGTTSWPRRGLGAASGGVLYTPIPVQIVPPVSI